MDALRVAFNEMLRNARAPNTRDAMHETFRRCYMLVGYPLVAALRSLPPLAVGNLKNEEVRVETLPTRLQHTIYHK